MPFLTVAGRGFYGRPEVRDLLNALSALADPADDVAMAGLLRSPVVALTDVSLYRLRLAGAKAGQAASLWDTLRAFGETLPEPEAGRARRATALIERLHGLVGRVPVAELLKAFLDATDYRAALLAAGQRRAARNVAKLLADAHEVDIVSIGEFLEYIGSLRDSDAREGEARAIAEGVVQIMSVHAAKGLEWPVVVIGDANYQRTANRQPPLLHPKWGLLLGLKDEAGETSMMYRLAQREEAEREEAEVARLLYVASTRARERLILSGCVSLTAKGVVERRGGWLAGIVGPDGVWPLPPLGDDVTALRLTFDVSEDGPVARCTIYKSGWSHERRAIQADRLPRPACWSGRTCRRILASPGMDAQDEGEAAVPARVCGGSYRPGRGHALRLGGWLARPRLVGPVVFPRPRPQVRGVGRRAGARAMAWSTNMRWPMPWPKRRGSYAASRPAPSSPTWMPPSAGCTKCPTAWRSTASLKAASSTRST